MAGLEDEVRAAKRAFEDASTPLCDYSDAEVESLADLCREAVIAFRVRRVSPRPVYLHSFELRRRLPNDGSNTVRLEDVHSYRRLPADGWLVDAELLGDEHPFWVCGVICTDGTLIGTWDHLGKLGSPGRTEVSRVRGRGLFSATTVYTSRVEVDEPPADGVADIVSVRRWPPAGCEVHGSDHPVWNYGSTMRLSQFRESLAKTLAKL